MKFFKKIIKILKLLRKPIWIKGMINQIAANVELENLVQNLKFNTVLDIGSNKGQFILLLEGYYKKKLIYSFEPIKQILKKQKNFFKYKKDIFFLNIGLGNKKNIKKTFFITKREDSSSFLKVNYKLNQNDNFTIKSQRKINLSTVDSVMKNKKLKEPILIKIDVQGYELEVLKGSKNFLNKVKYLIIEVSSQEIYKTQSSSSQIIEFLKLKNFKIIKQNLSSSINKTNANQRDILFENKNI